MKKAIIPLIFGLCVLSSSAYASVPSQVNDSTSTGGDSSSSNPNGSGTGTSGGTDSSGSSGGGSYR